MKNPFRPVWDWLLWWPLRGLMSRPVCQTADRWEQLTGKTPLLPPRETYEMRKRAFGPFDHCGHTDEEIAVHPDWTCPEAMDYHERVEVKHPYRHPDPHSHAGVDECFVCNEHAEATGCVTQHHRGLSKADLALLQDPDTWDFGALE